AQPAVPEIEERRQARLQRAETKAVAVVLDVAAVQALDELLDARPRFPGRARQAAGEVHVVLALQLSQFDLEDLQLAFELGTFSPPTSSRDQKPDERKPQFAAVGNGAIVDEHFGLVETSDDFEQIAKLDRVARRISRSMAELAPAARLAILR